MLKEYFCNYPQPTCGIMALSSDMFILLYITSLVRFSYGIMIWGEKKTENKNHQNKDYLAGTCFCVITVHHNPQCRNISPPVFQAFMALTSLSEDGI